MSPDQTPSQKPSDAFSASANRALDDMEASLRAALPGSAAEVAVVVMRLVAVVVIMPPIIILMILEEVGPLLRAIVEPFLMIVSAIVSGLFNSNTKGR